MNSTISAIFEEAIQLHQLVSSDKFIISQIDNLASACLKSLRSGGKVMFAGNGGSFADSQHLAAEFVSRLAFDRSPLPAIALGTNISSTTAIGNDFGYELIFARELQALGNKNDVFIPISTSGNSRNILAAVKIANDKGMTVVAFSGETGGLISSECECIKIPSKRTERIQECHILIGHIVCLIAEQEYFHHNS